MRRRCWVGPLLLGILIGWPVGTTKLDAAESRPPQSQTKPNLYKSPQCVAFSPDGHFAYVTNQTADSLSVVDVAGRTIAREIAVGRGPSGLVVAPDGGAVFVAATLDHSISVVRIDADVAQIAVVAKVKCGFEPVGLCLSPDGATLYSANYISNDVSVIDTAAQAEVARIPVGRTPRFLAITPDGATLAVHNTLSFEPSTNERLSAFVSLIDTARREVTAEKRPAGGMLMGEGIAVSTDGKYAYCVHLRPNSNVATTQLNQGWIQTNALTVVPLTNPDEKVVTFLLDKVTSGAANPCGVAVSKDGRLLYITHRGIHKLSVIDLPAMHAVIASTPANVLARSHALTGFLWSKPGVIRRVDCGGLGPRGIAVSPLDGTILVANYFSDALAVLDPTADQVIGQIPLGPAEPMTVERRGEFLFHDGLHCFQQWLSCTSCHPGIRADGLNWDLLNDGMTNPKNVKPLVGAHETAPMMWRGVRPTMEAAVEKGFLFIEFHTPLQEEIDAVSAYLRSLKHIPSPWHRNSDGSLDDRAARGEKVFQLANCDLCHPPPLYTNLKSFDVDTVGPRDFAEKMSFDTPSLRELYRSGPYLHDGRAATLEEVLIAFNRDDFHGNTSKLTNQEVEDLVAFLMTL